MIDTKIHQNVILKLGAILLMKQSANVIEIGEHLQKTGIDDASTGGFWLYGYNVHDCYLSDKFISSLGYSREEVPHSVDFLYKTAENTRLNKSFEMIDELVTEQSEKCFINYLDYKAKDGETIKVECTGTVIYSFGKPLIVIGTHDIV